MLDLIFCPLNSIGELPCEFARCWNKLQPVQPFEGCRCVRSSLNKDRSWCQTLFAWAFILSRRHLFSFPLWYSTFPALLLLHWWKHTQFLQFKTPTYQSFSHLRKIIIFTLSECIENWITAVSAAQRSTVCKLTIMHVNTALEDQGLKNWKVFWKIFGRYSSQLIVNDNKG